MRAASHLRQPALLPSPTPMQYLEKGGRFGRPQSARKGCSDPIRCYG